MRKNVIICPKCGAEYLPSEIYIPQSLLGKPYHIMRFNDGTIDEFFGKDMDLDEQYICDYCDTKFYIKAIVKFNTSINEMEDFQSEYKTKLHKAKLFLDEN